MDSVVPQLTDATQDDFSDIATLHAKSWQENYHEVLSADYLKDKVFTERNTLWIERSTFPKNNQQVIVAKVDGELAGFICVFADNHEKYGTIIDNLHVAARFKGCGIGTKLLQVAAKWAYQFDASLPLYLEVLACNTKAMGFYASLGAKQIATAYWHTPCGNQTKEYVYGWHSAKTLICGQ